jgi:hypothetical protein
MIDAAFDRLDSMVEWKTVEPGTEDRPEMRCTGAGTNHAHWKHCMKILALARGSTDVRRRVHGHIGMPERPYRSTQAPPSLPQRSHQTLEQHTTAKHDRLHARCGRLKIMPKRPWLAGLQDVQPVTLHACGGVRLARIQRAVESRQHIGHACARRCRGSMRVLRMTLAAKRRCAAKIEERGGLRHPLSRDRHVP